MNTLPRKWSIIPLGSTCELISGQHINAKDYNVEGKGIGYLTGPADFGKLHPTVAKWTENPKRTAVSGDILLTVKGSGVGKINLMPDEELAISRQLMAIRSSSIDMGYLYSFLQLQYSYFQSLSNGAAIPGISRSDVLSLQIPVPPLPEQQRIVSILDEVFEGIGKAVANVERNIENSRELFESYLNNKLFYIGSAKPMQPLSDITELIVDCEHKTAPTQEIGYPSIRTPNIGKGELILDGVKRVSEETYKIWTRRAVPVPGDLILAREAPAGNVGVIPKNEQVCLGQRTVLIRPKKKIINSKYLAMLMLHPLMQKNLLSHSTGATVQHVNMKDIRKLSFGPLPSLSKQTEEVKDLDKIGSYVNQLEDINKEKLKSLEELKQSILQKAFTGELTAKTINKLMEPV